MRRRIRRRRPLAGSDHRHADTGRGDQHADYSQCPGMSPNIIAAQAIVTGGVR
ncbi:hypothetical protein [Modicisalibacter muralis]|uniref:hypothetical protein n=1 Tax=Modicisalibacter muralis TaxID=119000 RepID=UPI001587F10B|nr:hypothetical protein [Halomonas muralis]